MVVEDDLQVRQSLAEILELEGYTVTPTSTGEAALTALALHGEPAVVILDLWLPGMGSVEFVRHLRQRSCLRIPLIIMTAWASSHDLGMDADAVLLKPAEPTAIVRAVDRLAVRRAPARRAARRPRVALAGRG